MHGPLSPAEQHILVKALLADGMTFKANVFQFLPLYLERSKVNVAIGLGPALEVLVGLVELLKKETCGQRAELWKQKKLRFL